MDQAKGQVLDIAAAKILRISSLVLHTNGEMGIRRAIGTFPHLSGRRYEIFGVHKSFTVNYLTIQADLASALGLQCGGFSDMACVVSLNATTPTGKLIAVS